MDLSKVRKQNLGNAGSSHLENKTSSARDNSSTSQSGPVAKGSSILQIIKRFEGASTVREALGSGLAMGDDQTSNIVILLGASVRL